MANARQGDLWDLLDGVRTAGLRGDFVRPDGTWISPGRLNPRVQVQARIVLGPPARSPFSPVFWGFGLPTKIDQKEKSGYQLILSSLLEDVE